MAIARLLEYLATQRTTLSEVVAGLPKYHIARSRAACPWENKGTVMRLLNEQYGGGASERVDGLKIRSGDEWVLILPDPDRPLFYVHAESAKRHLPERHSEHRSKNDHI